MGWVEVDGAGWSWNDLGGGGWRWEEMGAWFSNTHSISDNQDYFEYIVKKHGEKTVNPSIRIYINKIENRIAFKIDRWYSSSF